MALVIYASVLITTPHIYTAGHPTRDLLFQCVLIGTKAVCLRDVVVNTLS